MKKNKTIKALHLLIVAAIFNSCASSLDIRNVAYQSVRNVKENLPPEPGTDAKIFALFQLDNEGNLYVTVKNLSKEIMTVDKTKSFFVDNDGTSHYFYDPSVRTTSSSITIANGSGTTVNLGIVDHAFDIGGVLGSVLHGTNVSSSSTDILSTSNSVTRTDMPQLSIAPNAQSYIGRSFALPGYGKSFLKDISTKKTDFSSKYTPENTYQKFRVVISYTIEGDGIVYKMNSEFYANAIASYAVHKGKVNDALRNIYNSNPEALKELCYLYYFIPNKEYPGITVVDDYSASILYDYQ